MNRDKVEPIRPQLSQAEIERRNQLFKNWGRYGCYGWKAGQPTVMLTATERIAAFMLIEILATWKLILTSGGLCIAIQLFLLGAVATSVYFFLTKDPGVSSSCLPVANQERLVAEHDYCRECRIYCQDGIRHCIDCCCCIKDSLFHSWLFQRCITAGNYRQWSAVLASTISSCLFICSVIVYYRFKV